MSHPKELKPLTIGVYNPITDAACLTHHAQEQVWCGIYIQVWNAVVPVFNIVSRWQAFALPVARTINPKKDEFGKKEK
jgi:hypothetical protein